VTPVFDRARYAEAHTTQLTETLASIAHATEQRFLSAEMISGPVVSTLLATLVYVLDASLVVEIGTFTGFSAVAMAASLGPDGRLITLEHDPDHAAFAQRRIAEAGLSERAEVRLGPALDSLDEIDGPIDLVFIDADKQQYLDFYDAVLPKLAPRGLIVADNTLSARGTLTEFNERIRDDPRVVASVLTVRAGLTVIRRAA
jgi:caffeoyl-CoA O-methyltransferase